MVSAFAATVPALVPRLSDEWAKVSMRVVLLALTTLLPLLTLCMHPGCACRVVQ